MAMKRIDETGHRYGRLVVVSATRCSRGQLAWLCRCDCGKTTITSGNHLRSGGMQSCGCHRAEVSRRLVAEMSTTHGMSRSPEHRIWTAMVGRCTSPTRANWNRYGGAGITVCKEWVGSFEQFYRDMGPRPSPQHSIDRIDNKKGYEPGNCRWATPKEQSHNREVSCSFDAQTLALIIELYEEDGFRGPEIAKLFSVSIWTIMQVIKRTHWSWQEIPVRFGDRAL